jgi:hypothetical protein
VLLPVKKSVLYLLLALCIAAVAVSVVSIVIATRPAEKPVEAKTDIQYVMYLGTNDKDTVEPVFPPEEAKQKAIDILLKHFGGYTIQEASGGWIDGEKIYTEYTLVIYLSDTDMEHVHAAADELVETFHQSSVLIQSNQTITEFYSGKN